MDDHQTIRELTVERLVLREPNQGRARAVIETVPIDSAGFTVRLTLLDPLGEPALVAEVNHEGEPVLHVGHPDRGTTVTVTTHGVDLWSMGNVVASLRSEGTEQDE